MTDLNKIVNSIIAVFEKKMNFEFEVKTEIYFEEMIDRDDCSKCKIYRCSCYYYQYVI